MRKMMPNLMTSAAIGVCLAILSIALAPSASAQAEPVIVNVENFVRAETAAQFDRVVANAGGVNRFFHLREPAPLDQQTVIRMNRDTIYSSALVDISEGATVTVPDAGDRYMSIMVVNEDHYLNKVFHEPGPFSGQVSRRPGRQGRPGRARIGQKQGGLAAAGAENDGLFRRPAQGKEQVGRALQRLGHLGMARGFEGIPASHEIGAEHGRHAVDGGAVARIAATAAECFAAVRTAASGIRSRT